MPSILDSLGEICLSRMKEHGLAMLSRDAGMSRFLRRLRKSWRHPLELFRTLIKHAETGSEYCVAFGESAAKEPDFVFQALARLHVRSCRIANEVYCLLESGFASAAHARWRTLHRLNVVSWFVRQGGAVLAKHYLLHHVAQRRKSMETYQNSFHLLGLEPLSGV